MGSWFIGVINAFNAYVIEPYAQQFISKSVAKRMLFDPWHDYSKMQNGVQSSWAFYKRNSQKKKEI